MKSLEELKEQFLGECLVYMQQGQPMNLIYVREIIEKLAEQASKEIDEQNEAAYHLLVKKKELEKEIKELKKS